MPPAALPQLLDTLLRLPHLDATQLRELLHHLPDPQASAQEMLCRGWITSDQFSSLFPDPPQQPTPPATIPPVCEDDAPPPDIDDDDWGLILIDEEKYPEPAPVKVIPVITVADEIGVHQPASDADSHPNRGMGWASTVLLMGFLFLVSFGAALPFFLVNSTAQPVAPSESRQALAKDLVWARVVPPAPLFVQGPGPKPPPVAAQVPPAPEPPPAPVRPADVKPQPRLSLYERVRQVVRENRTVETDRLGMGDFAYQHVPEDGSIIVGMEVTYAPFFSQNIIKSVRPIYQRADGTRYDGPVCGTPTFNSERVVARDGYAIGGATIKAGMGIDGVQLTFMEIGAEGLNPNKSYLSKWLGGYGGAWAKTYVNDGRPIIGIAGMVSKNSWGPAFCLCLVTLPVGACAEDGGPRFPPPRIINGQPDEGRPPPRVGQAVWIEWGGQWWNGTVLQVGNGQYYVAYDGYGPEWNIWVGPDRLAWQ